MISFVMTVDVLTNPDPEIQDDLDLDLGSHSDNFRVFYDGRIVKGFHKRRDDSSEHKFIANRVGTTPGGKAVFVGVGTRRLLQGLSHLDSTKLKRLKNVTGSRRTWLLGAGIKAHATTGVLLPPIIWAGQNINMYAELVDDE